MKENLGKIWETLKAQMQQTPDALSHTALPNWVFVLAALFVVSTPQLWKVFGYLVTVSHESGHALSALTVGRRLHGVKIRHDMSGELEHAGGGFLPFRAWTAWWGYPFPAVLGGFYVWAAVTGWQGPALTATLLIGVLMWFQIRSFFALLTITVTCVATWGVWWFLPSGVTATILFSVGWFLLFGGARSLVSLTKLHARGETEGSDARSLQKITFVIPGVVWLASFWVATVAGVIGAFWSSFVR